MAEALHEAYSDLFVINANPVDADRPLIEGKFKSAHNVSDRVAKLMAATFYALLSLADLRTQPSPQIEAQKPEATKIESEKQSSESTIPLLVPSLHYDIQIHLPATKDIEVFNAIFKSLREHLIQ